MVECKSTAEEVSFEWSHCRFSSTEFRIINIKCLHMDAGSQKVKTLTLSKLKKGLFNSGGGGGGGGGVLPYISYIGMCCPKGYGF